MESVCKQINSIDLFAHSKTVSQTGLNSVYERLADPVAQSECTVHNILTNQNAFINELSPTYHSKQSFELYPITQPLMIHPSIDQEIWKSKTNRAQINQLWINSIDRYTHIPTAGTYESCILKNDLDDHWNLPLFGNKCNALLPVLQMAAIAHAKQCDESVNYILHYITMIVLQYYLMERNQFMQSTCGKDNTFRDCDPPYIFMLYMRYDIKRGHYNIDFQQETMAEAAVKYDFISLLFSVLSSIVPQCNDWFIEETPAQSRTLCITDNDINTWCEHKMFVTKVQLLITSRFIHMHVHEYTNHIRRSLELINTHAENAITCDKLTKHFKLIKNHKMHELHFTGKDPLRNDSVNNIYDARNSSANQLAIHQIKIPTFFCHIHFSPVTPNAIFPPSIPSLWEYHNEVQAQQLSNWMHEIVVQTSKMIDSTLISKIAKSVNRINRSIRHKNSGIKLYQKIGNCDVSPVRVRYAYTIIDNQMYTKIGDVIQSPRHSETCPLWISKPAWLYMASLRNNENCVHPTPFSNKSLSKVQISGYSAIQYCINLSQQEILDIYLCDSLKICIGTFDYWCVSHLSAIYCGLTIEYNTYLMFRALIILLRSEKEAVVEIINLITTISTDPIDHWSMLSLIQVS
jgi:hypothetical protein